MAKSILMRRGQALIVIILIMAVVLTIALSVASHTIGDINISQKEDDSARAFSAAEAGVEQALLKNSSQLAFPGEVSNDSQFRVEVNQLASGGTEFASPSLLSSGETTVIWLVARDAGTSEMSCSGGGCYTGSEFKICWGEGGTADNADTTPAIELSMVYMTTDDVATARIARGAYDPYTGRSEANNFTRGYDVGETIDSVSFQFCRSVNLTSSFSPSVTLRPTASTRRGPQYAKVRMFYNTAKAHPVGIKLTDSATLPLQGKRIVSTGVSGSAQRRLEVFEIFPDPPPIFDTALFSGSGGIVK